MSVIVQKNGIHNRNSFNLNSDDPMFQVPNIVNIWYNMSYAISCEAFRLDSWLSDVSKKLKCYSWMEMQFASLAFEVDVSMLFNVIVP